MAVVISCTNPLYTLLYWKERERGKTEVFPSRYLFAQNVEFQLDFTELRRLGVIEDNYAGLCDCRCAIKLQR